MPVEASQVNPQTPAVEATVLRGLELNGSTDPTSFSYNQQYGGLVQRQEDGFVRLLMFRANSDPATHPSHASQGDEHIGLIPRVNDTFYGTGLYLGNTPQAVSIYGWKPDRQVSAFLTPPIRPNEIADRRSSPERAVTAPRRLGRHAVKSVTMRLAKAKVVDAIDADYGFSKLAIQDMGPDAYIMQRVLARRHDYPVKPAWYIWRSTDKLEEVGTVPSLPVIPNGLGRAVLKSRAK